MMAVLRKAIFTAENESALIRRGRSWNFHQSDTRELLHVLHPYPAKFIPQIPNRAIATWTKPGALVYDPFCGCGTTLLEAVAAGRNAVGTDNNAVALLISRAKTRKYRAVDLKRASDATERIASNGAGLRSRKDLVPDTKNLSYWYPAETIARLAAIKGVILEEREPVQSLLLAVFSSILVKVSFQDSDTRYARVERDLSTGDVDRAFAARARDVIASASESSAAIRGTAEVHQADARSIPMIGDRTVDLIVTSPPYLNAYDYHKYHRQRLHWIGGDVEFARDLEIGSHDEFTKPRATPDAYFADMRRCATEWRRVLRRGGRCLVVVGDAIVSTQPVAVGDQFVSIFEDIGLRLEERWIRALKSTSRSFNVKNCRITHEHGLLFRKP